MTKCTECDDDVGETPYNPMEGWNMKAPLCGKCYSTKLEEHYPGKHIRVNRLTEND